MRRDRLTAGVIIAVAGALVAAGTTFLVGKSGHSSAPVRGPGAVHISLGDVTSHAAQITVGGQTYQLQPGWSGTHHATVALTPDAGGVAVVRDRAGNVLATAPVWAVPGQPSKAAKATCRSTAFDQFLLTPGVACPDPLGVDLLWDLAGHGQTGRDVAALGRAHLRRPQTRSRAPVTSNTRRDPHLQQGIPRLLQGADPACGADASAGLVGRRNPQRAGR